MKDSMLRDARVAVSFTGLTGYPERVPFHPPECYPELPHTGTDPENRVYSWVRKTLQELGLDRENFGTASWNPLGELIEPGMTVLIKPNLVLHKHLKGLDIYSMIVHASVVRPMLDFVCVALKGKGRIILGDAQQIFGLFDKVLEVSRIGPLLQWYRQQTAIPIECFDFRINRGVTAWVFGGWGRVPVEADPHGYLAVDLGNKSCLRDFDFRSLRISVASHLDMRKYHGEGHHAYLFPKSLLASDVILNIAKLKTHRRMGVSLALKNVMGLPSAKESLPHFRLGSPEENGDEYAHRSWRKQVCAALQDQVFASPSNFVSAACATLKKLLWETRRIIPFRDNISEGMWPGNDTLWRTVLDLNRAVLYASTDGIISEVPQRRYFCLLDGIVGGEENGPLEPHPVQPGVLLAAHNPVALDVAAATLMGFDPQKIPLIQKSLSEGQTTPALYLGTMDAIRVLERGNEYSLVELAGRHNLRIQPHPNWKGRMET